MVKKATKVTAKRRYADGGSVQSPSLMNRLKGLYNASKDASDTKSASTATITGGFPDALQRRRERMDAMERGESDPGAKTKDDADKYARGGKVKRRK